MLHKKLLVVVVSSLILAACSTGSNNVQWTDFNHQQIKEDIGQNASVVFFRDNSGAANKAVNVIINGEYQASLQQNGYSQAIVCAQQQRLGAFLTGSDPAYAKKHSSGQYFNVQAGKVSYFKVSVDAANNVSLTEVSSDIAKSQIQPNKHQANTLSRVEFKNTCGERKYVLDAAALFPFNQSSLETILPRGRDEIKEIGADILRYPTKLNAIEVIGYSDPEGSEQSNRQVSQQRAQVVKTLLVQTGVDAKLVQARGVGSADLIVKNCATQYAADKVALQACNQPNRRVEIKLHSDN